MLIIPPRCLLQNFRGGDSLGFRNASLRRRGWQISANPKLPWGWLLLARHSSRVSHFLSRDQTLLSQCSVALLLNEMEKCKSCLRWSNSHITSKHIKPTLLQIKTSHYLTPSFSSFFFFKGSRKFKLHYIQQTGFQETKPKPNISSFVSLSNVLLRALSKNKYDLNIILRLLESVTKLAN